MVNSAPRDACITSGESYTTRLTIRVGDSDFNRTFDGLTFHRVVNDCDVVPMVPTPGPLLWFKHAGQLLRLTADGIQSSENSDSSSLGTALDAIRGNLIATNVIGKRIGGDAGH